VQEFVYVSAIEGHLVTRFPSLAQPVAQYIGATRQGKKIVWSPDQVVAIPDQEWRKYRREYRRAVADGSLKMRTKEDFDAWQAKRKAADEADQKKAQEAKQKAADAEAKRQRGEAPAAPAATPEQQPTPAPSTGDEQPAKASAPTASKKSGKGNS